MPSGIPQIKQLIYFICKPYGIGIMIIRKFTHWICLLSRSLLVPFAWVSHVILLLQNQQQSRKSYWICCLSFPSWVLHMLIKTLDYLTREWRGRGDSPGTCLSWMGNFKWLLRNGINKANIDGSKIKRKRKARFKKLIPAEWKSLDGYYEMGWIKK